MKKKKDEEFELKKPQPDEDRMQTCERAVCGVLDRLDAIEKRHEEKDQIRKWHEDNKPKFTIWEMLEHKGLITREKGCLTLTPKGKQIIRLFERGWLDDTRE